MEKYSKKKEKIVMTAAEVGAVTFAACVLKVKKVKA